MELDKDSLYVLKKLYAVRFVSGLTLRDLHKKRTYFETISALMENNMIREDLSYGGEDGTKIVRSEYVILQPGRAAFEAYRRGRLRWIIPTILSVIAITVSISSLLISLLK